MKKTYFLLLAILLIFPITIYAEEVEWHAVEYYENTSCISKGTDMYYSTEVEYSNGKYKLINPEQTDAQDISNNNSNTEYVYTCNNNSTECETVMAVILRTTCSPSDADQYRNYYVGFRLQDGKTYADTNKYYIGEDYTYENGIYTLKDYTAYDVKDIKNWYYISDNHEGKYMCDENMGLTCKKLYKIDKKANTSTGIHYTALIDVSDHYLVSNQYKKENNKYILINPQKLFPAEDKEKEVFTCRSKETTCDNLYKIAVTGYYDIHDGGRKSLVNKLTINNEREEKKLSLKDSYDVSTFFSSDELLNTFSTNKNIAEIKNNKLVLYKVGTTDIIYEDDFTYKVLHLIISETTLDNNPKTSTTSVFAIVLGLLLVTTLIVSKKKYFN